MIPKRAIFFWEGPEMSWLRWQSIESFKSLNPSWEIRLVNGSSVPIERFTSFESVLRSDWERYRVLHHDGGVYFDTDIVFCKPIPDAWLSTGLLLPLGDERLVDHVAVLGSESGDTFFKMLDEACGKVYRRDGVYNYQHFGVTLVNKLSAALQTRQVKWITRESFLPIPWYQPEKLWTDESYLSPLTYGVHWFGGDPLSKSLESRVDAEWIKASSCIVAKALKLAWASPAERDAHHDQLGV